MLLETWATQHIKSFKISSTQNKNNIKTILINHSQSTWYNAVIILTAMPGLQKSVICCMPHASTQSNCMQELNNSVCFLSYIQHKLAKNHSVAFERKMNSVNNLWPNKCPWHLFIVGVHAGLKGNGGGWGVGRGGGAAWNQHWNKSNTFLLCKWHRPCPVSFGLCAEI